MSALTLRPQPAATDHETPHPPGDVPHSFWQHPFVQDVLPFISSLVFHLGILSIGLLTYHTVKVIMVVPSEPAYIPEAVINGEEISHIPAFAGPDDGDPTRPYERDDVEVNDPNARGFGVRPTEKITAMISGMAGGEGDGSSDGLIAVGASNSPGFGKGTGLGSGTGAGTGTGGDAGLAPLGRPGGGSPVVFCNVRSYVTRVAYVCDASGSMMNKFDPLRLQLRRAIDVLKPVQSFAIVFFAEDGYIALDKQLTPALPETKRRAYDLIDKTSPQGSSDPIPGLRAAFATNPQLIYMLTDGDFPNNNQVLEEIRKLNAAKKVKINTIAFLDRGEEYEKLLKQIADENGGVFKFVSDIDLER